MLINDFVKKITGEYGIEASLVKRITDKKLSVKVDKKDAVAFLGYLKNNGFLQMSLITAVDWLEDGLFELVYTLVSWEERLTVSVSTFIDRKQPDMPSLRHIWPTARFYEWDINEFFGINFLGHPEMGNPLFLEGWDDLPPLRKDFDPLAYSYERYPSREYDFEMENKGKVIK